MDKKAAAEVAAQLDADPELLPYLDELLADLWNLGGNPDEILDLLRPLDLAPDSCALDLACGKGALAIPIAAELGWRVRGVDLYPPFIADARHRARAAGVADRCRFEVGDLRRELHPNAPYDVVLYASVGVLGPLDRTVGELRRAVRPGGYLVIDDGFLADDAVLDRPGYEHYAPYDETRRRLTRHGDRVVAERRPDPEQARRRGLDDTARIRRRAETLARRLPEKAALFRAYVARQEQECAVLESSFVGAVWLLEIR